MSILKKKKGKTIWGILNPQFIIVKDGEKELFRIEFKGKKDQIVVKEGVADIVWHTETFKNKVSPNNVVVELNGKFELTDTNFKKALEGKNV